MSDDLHDINSPSQLYRRALCPASARAETLAPVPASTPEQAAGTRKHDAARRLWADEPGWHSDLQPNETDEVILAVALARESLKSFCSRFGEDVLVLLERWLDLSEMGIPKGGTADVLAVAPGRAVLLIDYKFGMGYVEHPKNNFQFLAYGVGGWLTYGGEVVEAVKVQPNTDEQYRVMAHTFTAEELRAGVSTIYQIVLATQSPTAAYVPGGAQCGMCRAKFNCTGRQQLMAGVPLGLKVGEWLDRATPVARAELLEKLLAAEDWIKQAVDIIIARGLDTLNPMPIAGYKVGAGRRSYAWEDEATVLPALREIALENGSDPDSLVVTKIVSPAEAKKILGQAKKVRDALDKLIIENPGKPKLVKEDR